MMFLLNIALIIQIIPWFVIGAYGFSVWAYCVIFCFDFLYQQQDNKPVGLAFLIIFSVVVLFSIVGFFRVIIQRPYKLPRLQDDFEKQVETLELPEFFVCEENGLPRWCWTCARFRPNRFSHCAETGSCVSRKDHYCPWLGSIIELKRYKFFMQFLHYSFIANTFLLATMIPYLVSQGNKGSYPWQWITAVCINGFFCLFVLALLSSHYVLIFKGMSTAEDSHKQDRLLINVRLDDLPKLENGSSPRMIVDCHHLPGHKRWIHPWDMGWKHNFAEVFGSGPIDWFLPITPSPSDPYNWPIKETNKLILRDAAKKEWDRCANISPSQYSSFRSGSEKPEPSMP